jgi:hypothetical protein
MKSLKKKLLLLGSVFLIGGLGCAIPAHAQAPNFPYLYVGKAGGFKFLFLANGNSYTGTFVPTVTWACSDAGATLVPGADTTTVEVTISATDTNTSIVLTGTALAPDGKTQVVATETIPLLAEPVTYTGSVIQQSATN